MSTRSIIRTGILMILLICTSPLLMSQERGLQREEMHIRYRVAKAYIDKDYMGNRPVLDRIVEWAEEIQKDTMVNIVSVEFCGAVSPEGSVTFNHWLSVARLKALEKYVRQRVDIPEELIVRSDHYIAWDELKEMVADSDLPNKDDIMAVLNSENTSVGIELDSRIGALKALDNGKTWRILFNRYFADLRNAYMVIVTEKSEKFYAHRRRMMVSQLEPLTSTAKLERDPGRLTRSVLPPVSELADTSNMYIKTNTVGLGMLMGNLGVEFDLGNHLSLNIPVYYSAINYFSPTVKFRTLSTQPELRYWPKANDDGFFIGAHAGISYYNFAFNGDWRYQDHEGKTPAIGGGLSLGYRMPISKDENWKLEFSVGAGVYPLHYDVFHNATNVKEGVLTDTRQKTYIGLDNVQIGISYRIPMKKKAH